MLKKEEKTRFRQKAFNGSGGIRTHASEETGALNQRLRPLGHATYHELRPFFIELNSYLSTECRSCSFSKGIFKSLWRNRLARSAVNRKVGGSSPPRDVYFTSFPYIFTEKKYEPDVIRTRNLLIWSQTRYRCATGPDLEEKSNKKAYNTRDSQAVTHPSTNRARRCLTSVIRREPVFSTWYGRRQRRNAKAWFFLSALYIYQSSVV